MLRTYTLVLLLVSSNGFVINPILKKNLSIRKSFDLVDIETSLAINTIAASSNIIFDKKYLTQEGLYNAWFLGNILWIGLGYKAWLTGFIYFILGSMVTKIKMKEKEELGIAEKRSGARGPENVWGSAGTAAICSLLSLLSEDYLISLAFVSSFATKLSDTFASEIGKAYGKNCYLITNFKKVPRGTEGAISLEGTLAGIIGSIILSIFASYINLMNYNDIYLVVMSAFIATNCESVLGVIIQDKQKWITNEFINFINTTIGAISVILLKMNI